MRQTQHTRADQTRDRILRAAIREFSEHGLAGARTGAIATAARVNKALLYYYFRDKEALYTAALEEVAGKVAGDAIAVLDLGCSPGERVLRFALQHFDRNLSHHGFQSLMQQEMVRFRTGQSHAMRIIAKNAFEPMWDRALSLVHDGIGSGELCNVDPMQMMYAALGANVFYFLSAPMVRLVTSSDPLEPGPMAERRTAAIEYLGQTIFTDRRRGARLAKAVLAAMPIPASAIPERKTA
jgi:TetR/AcrR family transcriptional regulator